MILPKLSLLLATAAASASVASGAELTGYLMDRLCINNCMRDLENGSIDKTGGCNPDGSNSFFTPQDHTGWCLLLPPCISSGYMLMSESTDADGKHSIIANFTDDVSNEAVVQYINATSDGGKRIQFPMATVVFADDAVAVESDGASIVQVSNAEIKDPWPTSAYDGADTTQVIVSSASDADIALNNMGFRSDVMISTQDAKGMYVIESNGCPDHESMSGGSAGVVFNSQAEPGTDVCSAAGANTCGNKCGGCGNKCGGCGNQCGGCGNKCGGCGGNECKGQGKEDCCAGGQGKEDCCAGGQGKEDCCAGGQGKEDCCAGGQGKEDCCAGGQGKEDCCAGGQGKEDCCAGGQGKEDCCAGGQGNKDCSNKGCGVGSCSACSGVCEGTCSSSEGCGNRNLAGCCSCGGCGGCGCGSKSCDHTHGPYDPMYQHYTMMIPQAPGTPGDATTISDDVVGIMSNGVLLDSHSQTWSYDECNGHSDKKHQYHYHIPPICYLKSMGVTFPSDSSWWVNDAGDEVRPYEEMASQFAAKGSSPVVGFARDGYPIYALYDTAGDLQSSSLYDGDLDECNGKDDGNGYAYYITAHPPFAPKCLRGNIGSFSYATTDVACPKAGIKNSIESAIISAPQETPAPSPSSGNRAVMPLLIALAPAMAAIASYLL